MSEFHIASHNPIDLEPRIRVSSLRLAEPNELQAGGYVLEGAVIPTGPLRSPTSKELDHIAVPYDDPEAIRLFHVPPTIGRTAIQAYDEQSDEWMPLEIGPNVFGELAVTVSFANELSTTVKQETQERVGLHIDAWPDITRYLGVNLGPGRRYICIAPNAKLATMADALSHVVGAEARAWRRATIREYVRDNFDPADATCYFVRLNEPGIHPDHGEYFEAYGNMRVDRILHDGSTTGMAKFSRVALIKTPLLPVDFFPSAFGVQP